ncbi:MAG: hypothetical protein ACRDEB_07865, partial [Chitinophagaceae bacterium]
IITNQGFSHGFAAKLISFIHGFILIEVYWLRYLRQEYILLILFAFMLLVVIILKNLGWLLKKTWLINHTSIPEG